MSRASCFICLLFIAAGFGFSQDEGPTVEELQRDFSWGDYPAKMEILRASEAYPNMDRLYLQSLHFVIWNAEKLRDHGPDQELALLTIQLIRRAKTREATLLLWDLFRDYEVSLIRREILTTLGEIAGGNIEVISAISRWVEGRNDLFRGGYFVDSELFGAVVTILGKLKSEISFPSLFSATTLGYPVETRLKAETALRQLQGDHKKLIIPILENNPLPEKNFVLRFVIQEEEILPKEKAEIAKAALEISLKLSVEGVEERETLLEFRRNAVGLLIDTDARGAAAPLIECFDEVLFAVEKGTAPRSDLIQTVNALGKTNSPEAAERLTLYIGLLNLQTENGQPVDEEIVLTVIRNLSLLGDKIAFDQLLYIRHLQYSPKIKRAARKVMEELRR